MHASSATALNETASASSGLSTSTFSSLLLLSTSKSTSKVAAAEPLAPEFLAFEPALAFPLGEPVRSMYTIFLGAVVELSSLALRLAGAGTIAALGLLNSSERMRSSSKYDAAAVR